MKTLVYPPLHDGLGRYRTVGVVQHPLTVAKTRQVLDELAEAEIFVAARLTAALIDLFALAPTTTEQEVTALHAFIVHTDARLIWHPVTTDLAEAGPAAAPTQESA